VNQPVVPAEVALSWIILSGASVCTKDDGVGRRNIHQALVERVTKVCAVARNLYFARLEAGPEDSACTGDLVLWVGWAKSVDVSRMYGVGHLLDSMLANFSNTLLRCSMPLVSKDFLHLSRRLLSSGSMVSRAIDRRSSFQSCSPFG